VDFFKKFSIINVDIFNDFTRGFVYDNNFESCFAQPQQEKERYRGKKYRFHS
jgi:hypothetical protein